MIANDPVASYFASLDQGILFEHFHRYDEAETAFRALIVHGDPGSSGQKFPQPSWDLPGAGEAAGPIAVATYDQALGRAPGDPTLLAAKARAASRHDAPAMESLDASASEALTALSSTLVARKQSWKRALAYLRLALRLYPERDAAWLLASGRAS